jgi:hypothetical protein
MTFEELQKLLKESGDSQLLELVDSLASAILLISPIATAGALRGDDRRVPALAVRDVGLGGGERGGSCPR